MEEIKQVAKCRACGGTSFKPWFDLGVQPIANNLVSSSEMGLLETTEGGEKFFPLKLMVCLDCNLVQTAHVVSPDHLFKDYKYRSSVSDVFKEHFRTFAQEEFNNGHVKPLDLVVDIGSNDGILLQPFKELGARVVGVEPADEVAGVANELGIPTIAQYFTPDLANAIREEYGEAKLITATNVFAHIDDLDQILDGVKLLLAPNGQFVIEIAYLPRMLEQGTFDLIYHEHLCYWHLKPLQILLNRKGFVITNTWEIDVHGGSIRVYTQVGDQQGEFKGSDDSQLVNQMMFGAFPEVIRENRKEIVDLLAKLKQEKKRIIGYGAPAKMSTMTNYFDLGPETFDYIIDEAKSKQGFYSPGKHIRIVPPVEFKDTQIDYIFIFAWNFAESIIARCKAKGYNGKFIIPFPNVRVE